MFAVCWKCYFYFQQIIWVVKIRTWSTNSNGTFICTEKRITNCRGKLKFNANNQTRGPNWRRGIEKGSKKNKTKSWDAVVTELKIIREGKWRLLCIFFLIENYSAQHHDCDEEVDCVYRRTATIQIYYVNQLLHIHAKCAWVKISFHPTFKCRPSRPVWSVNGQWSPMRYLQYICHAVVRRRPLEKST